MSLPKIPQFDGVDVFARLSRGGMGEIYLARRSRPHGFARWVVFKLIRPDMARSPQIRAMFLDEARLLARLEHPAIAQVQDFGEVQGTPFLMMEYVAGLSLRDLYRLHGPVPAPVAARMIAEVARGLHAAHQLVGDDGTRLGIVHRDVSPHNILLSFEGRMKLIDFGIALAADRVAKPTSSGVVKGKLTYMAPEQIAGGEADPRTDVYGLSVVLHELLSGRPLFRQSESVLAAARERERPPRPSRWVRTPRRLEQILLTGLEARRELRQASALELAEALEGFATQGGSVEAFAAEELQELRGRHDRWLRGLPHRGGGEAPPVSSWLEPAPSEGTLDIDVELPRKVGLRPWLAFCLSAGLLALTGPRWGWHEVQDSEDPSVELQRAALGPDSEVSMPPAEPDPPFEASSELGGISEVSQPGAADLTEGDQRPRLETASSSQASDTAEAPHGAPPSPEASPESSPPPEPVARSRSARPPSRPAEARPESGWGRISIVARAGGWVIIDGEPFGRTPLRNARIRAGRHEIGLRRPGDDAPRWTSQVRVQDGRHLRIRLR